MNETPERGNHRRPKPAGGQRFRPRPVVVGAGAVTFFATVFGLNAALGDDKDSGGDPRPVAGCQSDCGPVPEGTVSAAPTMGTSVPPLHRVEGSASPTATPSSSPSTSPSTSASPSVPPSASPSPSPSRSTRPRPTVPATGRLVAAYQTGNDWGSGFIGWVTVTNRGSATVPYWRLSASFPGKRIRSTWTRDGSTQVGYGGSGIFGAGGSLAPGASVQIGFEVWGRRGGPISCILNGRSCWG